MDYCFIQYDPTFYVKVGYIPLQKIKVSSMLENIGLILLGIIVVRSNQGKNFITLSEFL